MKDYRLTKKFHTMKLSFACHIQCLNPFSRIHFLFFFREKGVVRRLHHNVIRKLQVVDCKAFKFSSIKRCLKQQKLKSLSSFSYFLSTFLLWSLTNVLFLSEMDLFSKPFVWWNLLTFSNFFSTFRQLLKPSFNVCDVIECFARLHYWHCAKTHSI